MKLEVLLMKKSKFTGEQIAYALRPVAGQAIGRLQCPK
jgi:hypothetical protein